MNIVKVVNLNNKTTYTADNGDYITFISGVAVGSNLEKGSNEFCKLWDSIDNWKEG